MYKSPWHKYRFVFWLQKLSESKLKSLFTELQFQDKEELKLKRLKADGQDKEGLMEAEIRRKFKGTYVK
jgi:hypothetical protein